MACKKRGYHLTTECEDSHRDGIYRDTDRKPKKLRSGPAQHARTQCTRCTQGTVRHSRYKCSPSCAHYIKSMNRNSVVSPFLRLPGEIRNKIYGFVVGGHHIRIGYTPHLHQSKTIKGEPHRIHVGGGFFHHLAARGKPSRRYQKAQSLHLGLLRVCRQVYGEAALLPYSANMFSFRDDRVMMRCLKTLRPAQKRAMGQPLCAVVGFRTTALERSRN